MKQFFGFILTLCLSMTGMAQHIVTIQVKDKSTREPLPGTSIIYQRDNGGAQRDNSAAPDNKGVIADTNGIALFRGLPAGPLAFRIEHIGYSGQTIAVIPGTDTLTVLLERAGEEVGEVVVSSTRSGRTLRNIPTRVEIINGDELEEKANMKPGDIRMMLSETTGIQTQQVSATSASSSIRIQGLDGRYTQILKDGFPLYAGFSGGLGLLQTPPLDLRQVEIIKGASSTLYGGGAIAGLVNLISKTPTPERDLRFLINGTTAGGLDVNGFYGQQFGKTGLTFYAARNTSQAFAPGNTPFTAIPKTEREVVEPKLFLTLTPRTKLMLGANLTWENRLGGDIRYVEGEGDTAHSYFERNVSHRLSTQFALEQKFGAAGSLTIKNAVNRFDRTLSIPGYTFDGQQWSTYTEVSYRRQGNRSDWIAGVNAYTDDFREMTQVLFPKRNYTQNTGGTFVQQTWKIASWLRTETGLRGDYTNGYGWAVLPRVSALFTLSPHWTSRVGGGLGYKTPTIFTEEAERIQFQNVLPVSPDSNKLERSYGVNADLNYRTKLWDQVSLSVNQLFFFTRINAPLELQNAGPARYHLVNIDGDINTKGFETNIKLEYDDFKWYIGYTFTDAHLRQGGQVSENPLTLRNRLNNILMYELENQLKIGVEAYYNGWQTLTDGTQGKPFWTFGIMGEKLWKHFSVFVNLENFTGTRQTRFDSIYTGTVTHPVFRDIYAPLDGFVANGGVKIRW
jgi:iron complex outermembrane receptor protein